MILSTYMTVGEINSHFKKSMFNIEQYRNDISEFIELEITKQTNTARYKQLEKNLKDNPIAESMDEGLFSFIADDVTQEAIQKKNITEELLGKIIKGAIDRGVNLAGLNTSGDKAFSAIKRLWMTEATPEGKGMMIAMQYSDFIAKDALFQHLLASGMDRKKALQTADDSFINYTINDSAMLDYLNKMGVFPFSKFGIRIVKIAGKLVIEKPVSVFQQVTLAYMASDLASSALDNNIFVNNMFYPFKNLGFGMNPSDVIETPYSFMFK